MVFRLMLPAGFCGMELFFFRNSLKRIIEELCIRFLFIRLDYIFFLKRLKKAN